MATTGSVPDLQIVLFRFSSNRLPPSVAEFFPVRLVVSPAEPPVPVVMAAVFVMTVASVRCLVRAPAQKQGHEEERQKHGADHLSDTRRRPDDPSKTQQGGQHGDDQESQGPA